MGICPHCKMDIAIRNPSGYCDHLYYPDACDICKNQQTRTFDWYLRNDPDVIIEKLREVFDPDRV